MRYYERGKAEKSRNRAPSKVSYRGLETGSVYVILKLRLIELRL